MNKKKSNSQKTTVRDKKGRLFCSLNSLLPERSDIYDKPRRITELDRENIIAKLLKLESLQHVEHVTGLILDGKGMADFLNNYNKSNTNIKDLTNLISNEQAGLKGVIPEGEFKSKMMSLVK